MTGSVHPASFRDPDGFLFFRDGVLYRQVNASYRASYEHLMSSGLFESLVAAGLLIPHEEETAAEAFTGEGWRIIRPHPVPFISYPYEWCFSQLRSAALATLDIQKRALEAGMSLKDCSAYNIQFVDGAPVLIDTLSFELLEEGRPWSAYRQFCQHFLAPLALMSCADARLAQLMRVHIDGIPLDLASRLLPVRTRLNLALLMHVHLHAGSQKHYAGRAVGTARASVSRQGLLGIIDSLQSSVERLAWSPSGTPWAGYCKDTNYTPEALDRKKELTARFLEATGAATVWDLGANTGAFSRIAAGLGARVVALDGDPGAVELHWLELRRCGEGRVLPLVMDLANPSPGLGWAGRERMSLAQRGPADAALALAIVHHLAIANNLPFALIAELLAESCTHLIIEFVPRSDSQVERLFAARKDIFTGYTQEAFEGAFGGPFSLEAREPLEQSQRVMYLMKRRR